MYRGLQTFAIAALSGALFGCADYDNAYFVHSVWRPADGGSTNAEVFYLTDRTADRFIVPDGFGYKPGNAPSCGSLNAMVPAARLPAHDAEFAKETGRHAFQCGDGEAALAAKIADAARANHCGSVLIYVHGFDTGFETAALRAAQMAADTQWRCTVASFSWSSSGRKDTYEEDNARIGVAEPLFADFLCALNGAGIRANIVAHSIGARLTMESMSRKDCAHADQVMLAAADIPVTGERSFAELQKAGDARFHRLTIYSSTEDVALSAARRFGDDRIRLGRDPDAARRDAGPNTDVIDASDAPGEIWAHNYFNFSTEMLSDMALVLADVPASARCAPIYGRDATLMRDAAGYRLRVDWQNAPDIFTRLFRWLASVISA